MPWSLQRKDEQWCVVKESDGSSEGCHDSRADAIKHQRALYANESRIASLYDELDAHTVSEPVVQERVVVVREPDALTATVLEQVERMSERQAATDQALVAALQAIGEREPVVNIHQAPVTVEPQFTVEAPNVTVAAAQVNVPAAQITVRPPDVNVTVENIVEHPDKTVRFTRNPQGQIIGAETSDV